MSEAVSVFRLAGKLTKTLRVFSRDACYQVAVTGAGKANCHSLHGQIRTIYTFAEYQSRWISPCVGPEACNAAHSTPDYATKPGVSRSMSPNMECQRLKSRDIPHSHALVHRRYSHTQPIFSSFLPSCSSAFLQNLLPSVELRAKSNIDLLYHTRSGSWWPTRPKNCDACHQLPKVSATAFVAKISQAKRFRHGILDELAVLGSSTARREPQRIYPRGLDQVEEPFRQTLFDNHAQSALQVYCSHSSLSARHLSASHC
jgi:hypothetical protein